MTVEAVEWRKSVSFTYDKGVVRGERAEISAANPDNEDEPIEPKKSIKNDGSGAVAFPEGYKGKCFILVEGSDGGSDEGLIEVV